MRKVTRAEWIKEKNFDRKSARSSCAQRGNRRNHKRKVCTFKGTSEGEDGAILEKRIETLANNENI